MAGVRRLAAAISPYCTVSDFTKKQGYSENIASYQISKYLKLLLGRLKDICLTLESCRQKEALGPPGWWTVDKRQTATDNLDPETDEGPPQLQYQRLSVPDF